MQAMIKINTVINRLNTMSDGSWRITFDAVERVDGHTVAELSDIKQDNTSVTLFIVPENLANDISQILTQAIQLSSEEESSDS